MEDWREDVQLPDKFKTHRPAFLKMLENFEGMSDRHLMRISESKHQVDLLKEEVWPVHSVSYRTEATAKQLFAAEINLTLTKNLIEPATTKSAGHIVLVSKKDATLRFFVD